MSDGRAPSPINNLRLSWKLGASVALLVLLLLGVALVGRHGLAEIDDLFRSFRNGAREEVFLADLRKNVLNARHDVLAFVTDRSDVTAEDARDSVQQVGEHLRAIDSTIADPMRRAEVKAIAPIARTYSSRFDDMAQAKTDLDARLSELGEAARRLRVALQVLLAVRLDSAGSSGMADYQIALFQEHALLGQVEAFRFLRDNDPEQAEAAMDKFNKAFDALERLVGDDADWKAMTADTATALASYRDTFATVIEAVERRNAALDDEMAPVARALLSQVATIAADQAERQAQIDAAAPARVAAARDIVLWLSVAAVVFAIVLAAVLVHGTASPIRKLTRRLDDIANGDTDFEVRERNSSDEFGRMWTALGKLREVARANYTRAQMIDQMPNSIMLADPNDDFRITYLNEATRQQLQKVEHLLPVSVDDVLGSSIDVFHKAPEHARAVLSDPDRLPHTAIINLGELEHMRLSCSAVHDRSGAYVGTMVSWVVVSEQVRGTELFDRNVKTTIDRIGDTFGSMRRGVDEIVKSVRATQGELTAGATAVNEASSDVQMVASAAEELASSITEISDHLSRSSRRAAEAAKETAAVVARAETLANASTRINEVVETISDIASKTNLLALNATIEAASAGEAGKGFAVVAQEVKNLASQTASATEEVAEQTAAIQSQIKTVVSAIAEVSVVIDEIRETFAGVAAAVEQQQVATREISQNAHNAAGGVETASRTMNRVEGLATSNLEAAESLSRAADDLSVANDNLSRESRAYLESTRIL